MQRIFLVLLTALWVPIVHSATGCVMVAHGAAQVQIQGEPRAAPLRLADCEGAKILSGTVSACFLNEKSERNCKTLNAGDSFIAASFGARKGTNDSAFSATLVSLLKGDPQVRAGQTRANSIREGFPYDNVLLPSGDMIIRLQNKEMQKLEFFVLSRIDGSNPPIRIIPHDARLLIAASELIRGVEYRWEAHGINMNISGRFKVAPTDDVAEMLLEASKLERNTLDAVSRRLLLAEIYYDNGFYFDAMELMAPLSSE
jgi:hypothetical protein